MMKTYGYKFDKSTNLIITNCVTIFSKPHNPILGVHEPLWKQSLWAQIKSTFVQSFQILHRKYYISKEVFAKWC